MKEKFCAILGAVGSGVAAFFGGWDSALGTLVLLMALDYLSGVLVAGVFRKSKKTASGALESGVGWKGLCRKAMTLVFVLAAHRLDLALGVDYLRTAVIIGFLANELLSLVENAGLMGLPLPRAVTLAVELLTRREEAYGEEEKPL